MVMYTALVTSSLLEIAQGRGGGLPFSFSETKLYVPAALTRSLTARRFSSLHVHHRLPKDIIMGCTPSGQSRGNLLLRGHVEDLGLLHQ